MSEADTFIRKRKYAAFTFCWRETLSFSIIFAHIPKRLWECYSNNIHHIYTWGTENTSYTRSVLILHGTLTFNVFSEKKLCVSNTWLRWCGRYAQLIALQEQFHRYICQCGLTIGHATFQIVQFSKRAPLVTHLRMVKMNHASLTV